MNKTVSINLGGFFFHIDEDAFQKLNRYFDAIRRSLSADGRDEIMSDIEARIAELLTEKLKNDKQVVSIREVDEVIIIMGRPEDYRIDDDETATGPKTSTNFNFNFNNTKTKKFYRDEESGMIGGVCAGLGHYFKIDPLWVRILFIVSLLLSFGSSILIYLVLLVLIPKAITTTEKLEMTGEPINISNIERKVKEEFSNLSDKLNNMDYDKLGASVKTGADKIGATASNAVLAILKVFAKVIGALLTVFSALTLGSLIIGLIAILFSFTSRAQWYPYFNSMNYTEAPMWLIGIIGFFAIAIPFFALFLLGLKILVDNLRPVGNLTKSTLLAIWILCVATAIYLGLTQASQFGNEGKTVSKQEIKLAQGDILEVKFKNNEYFTKSLNHDYSDFSFKQDSLGNEVVYSNNVRFYVLKTDEAFPYVQIEKIAEGSSISEARKSSETIKYNFKVQGNTLILDNYLLTGTDTKFHKQRVEIFLYLPEGTVFHPDASLKEYDDSDNEFFDLWFDGDHNYMMDDNHVQCLDCIGEEDNSQNEGNDDGSQNEPAMTIAPAPVAPPAPASGSQNGMTNQEKIRIMELEAEKARIEQEKLQLEHDIQVEKNKSKRQ